MSATTCTVGREGIAATHRLICPHVRRTPVCEVDTPVMVTSAPVCFNSVSQSIGGSARLTWSSMCTGPV